MGRDAQGTMRWIILAASIAFAAAVPVSPIFSSSYDHNLAERLVDYAGASYCAGQSSVAKWNCWACARIPEFQNITSVHDKKTDGRGIVGYDPVLKARVVSFMGTNANIKTWIDDILAYKQSNVSMC